jgi:hypothetical protein
VNPFPKFGALMFVVSRISLDAIFGHLSPLIGGAFLSLTESRSDGHPVTRRDPAGMVGSCGKLVCIDLRQGPTQDLTAKNWIQGYKKRKRHQCKAG